MTQELLIKLTYETAINAGIENPNAYTDDFLQKIATHNAIKQEYEEYLMSGNLSCEYSIYGYTVADIIIWQMDHFKALLDVREAQNKGNRFKMIIEAFKTMMDMEDNPEAYVIRMQETTGSDYEGKF